MTFVRATFDYEATEPQELTMVEGDIIEVVAEDPSGWWSGKLDGNTGLFPSNFCEPCDGDDIVDDVQSDEQYDDPIEEDDYRDVPPQQRGNVGVNPLAGMAMGELAGALANRRNAGNSGPNTNMEQKIKNNKRGGGGGSGSSGGLGSSGKKKNNNAAASRQRIDTSNLVIAKHDYSGAPEDDELSFNGDQMITVLKKDDSGWWQGELDSEIGWFPCTFVRELNEDEKNDLNPPEPEPEPEPVVKKGRGGRNPVRDAGNRPKGAGGGQAKRGAKKKAKGKRGAKVKRGPSVGNNSSNGPSQAEYNEVQRRAEKAERRVKELESRVSELEAQNDEQTSASNQRIETLRQSLQDIISQL